MLKRIFFSFNLSVRVNSPHSRCLNIQASDIRMKYLNVAEKNDAAKNIANFLSKGTSRRREGFSQYNKIYEFDGEVRGQRCAMAMTSVSGHLLGFEFVDSYKGWQTCDPVALFEAPVYKRCPKDYQNIKKTLENEIRTCQGLIIWTDCDREGENIGFEIIEVCTAVKPNLQIYRAKFSEITGISVRRALNNLEAPNKNVSDAVDVRQELDLRIGAAFTRFQTLRLQRVFPTKLANHLISYGSCQFPTLGFVVERYRAVENFVAEPFWKIKVVHTQNELTVEFAWDRVRLFDRDACLVLHDTCLEDPTAKVTDVKTKPKSKWRPLPLDTVELEKLASRKLKISAKTTMKIAEKLYTQGFISYPRTETNEYPKEMNLSNLVAMHTGDPNWGQFAQGILDRGGPTPRQGNKTDKAHPPIHPTKYANGLSGDEKRLYEFIVRSFLACCSQDAQGQETTVTIDVAGEKFSANGLMIIARNYLEVYPYDKWSAKEIHVYEQGQSFNPTSIEMTEGSTSPPNLLTEADLIGLMEKHGIGTDATHAEHIETIKSRSYVALLDNAHFVPGLLGMGLVDGYDSMGLPVAKPNLRAQLEADLKLICEGRKRPAQVLADQIEIYRQVYVTVTAEVNKLDAALAERFNERPNRVEQEQRFPGNDGTTAVNKCPKCGQDMTLRQKKDSDEFFIGCKGYPACKNAVWLPKLIKSVSVADDFCQQCGPPVKKLKFEWKKNTIEHLYPSPYQGCINGCDISFLEILNIAPNSRRNTGPTPNTNTRDNSNVISSYSETRIIPNSNYAAVRPNFNGNATAPSANSNPIAPRIMANYNPIGSNNYTSAPRVGSNSNPSAPRFGSNSNPSAPRIGSNSNSGLDDNEIVCNCNKHAILLTVKKQTQNFGKKFYKCVLSKENGGCDFFLWAPDGNDAASPHQTTSALQPQPTSLPWGVGSTQPSGRGIRFDPGGDDDVKCSCGLTAKTVTVHKEGPNKGRPFQGCPKPFNERCDFFQWADSAPGSNVQWGEDSGGYDGGGRGRGGRPRGNKRGGSSRGGASGASGTRKCGHCRKEGHTRNKCPELRDS